MAVKPEPNLDYAEITREHLQSLERTGPGGLIVYDHAAQLFQIVDASGFDGDEDTEALIVYGHGDLIHDLTWYADAYGEEGLASEEILRELLAAIDETACDLVNKWSEKPLLPESVRAVRRAFIRCGFHLDQRPHYGRDPFPAVVTDYYVFARAPHLKAEVRIPLTSGPKAAATVCPRYQDSDLGEHRFHPAAADSAASALHRLLLALVTVTSPASPPPAG